MNGLSKAARILLATLREIFDESAYERFLQRTQMAPSRVAYCRLPARARTFPGPPPPVLLGTESARTHAVRFLFGKV